jgi:hypothetical protein
MLSDQLITIVQLGNHTPLSNGTDAKHLSSGIGISTHAVQWPCCSVQCSASHLNKDLVAFAMVLIADKYTQHETKHTQHKDKSACWL